MSLIGQEALKNLFDKFVSTDVPPFIVLVGPKGHGKQTFAEYLRKNMRALGYQPGNLKIDAIRIMLERANALHEKTMFLLADADEMTIQAQNALLKFIEEPPKNAYIVMTIENLDNVLSTIQTRAQIIYMKRYSREELAELNVKPIYYSVFENVGQIQRAMSYDFEHMLKTAQNVADNVSRLNSANTFNILKHFKIEDADVFLQVLLYVYLIKMQSLGPRANGKSTLLNQVRTIYKFKHQLTMASVNKQNALEMMFLEMQGAKL